MVSYALNPGPYMQSDCSTTEPINHLETSMLLCFYLPYHTHIEYIAHLITKYTWLAMCTAL